MSNAPRIDVAATAANLDRFMSLSLEIASCAHVLAATAIRAGQAGI
jgi:hypothetical protein